MAQTVGSILKTTAQWLGARGIESSRLDAELLLAEVLEMERLQLYTSFDRPLGAPELDAYRELVRRRSRWEPVAYILGRKEFYSRDFAVDARVLVPRPDTEVLVDATLERISDDGGLVLDYGTGSGAIAITLAAENPKLRLLALDCSAGALTLARENAIAHDVANRVGFVGSDGLSRVPDRFRGEVLAIVANPPYIPDAQRDSLPPDVRDHEPAIALFAGKDPLIHYRQIAAQGPDWLQPSGFAAVEVGQGQAKDVASLFEQRGWRDIEIRPDLARTERVVTAGRPNS